MEKINITCLHGFFSAGLEGCDAVHIVGDDSLLTLNKGPAIDAWLTDETKITTGAGETTVKDENIRRLQLMLAQWLRGEELDPNG